MDDENVTTPLYDPSRISSDLSYVHDSARIAIYDDLLSSPRIIDIPPAPTRDFIGALASEIYAQAKAVGGEIPFTIIMQVTENFIHARFSEMVISIFDQGNTIRFSDQGPGIVDKEKAQQPGYSSATKEMKQFINGVGSGLPIVREYLETKQGIINIEDNLYSGAVVTISLTDNNESLEIQQQNQHQAIQDNQNISAPENIFNKNLISSMLSNKGVEILHLFQDEDVLGVTDIHNETGYATSSIHHELKKLEQLGLITYFGKKRTLTDLGKDFIS